jgi:hypothetical protein
MKVDKVNIKFMVVALLMAAGALLWVSVGKKASITDKTELSSDAVDRNGERKDSLDRKSVHQKDAQKPLMTAGSIVQNYREKPSVSAHEAQKSEDSAVLKYLEDQNYSDMSPVEIKEFLSLMTIGEGAEFETNKAEQLVKVSAFGSQNPTKSLFVNELSGSFTSDFVDSVPGTGELGYSVDLKFSKDRLDIAIRQNSQVYYQHTVLNIAHNLMIAKNPTLPPNLFIEMPAKPELGYLHAIHLELLIGGDKQTILGVLYNTDQFDAKRVDYRHSENLIFKKAD